MSSLNVLKSPLSRAAIAISITMLLLSSNVLPPAHAAAGDLDPTFGGDGKVTTDFGPGQNSAEDVAIQSDGKIVVVGTANVGGGLEFALARYNPNGDLDTSFGNGGKVVTNFSRLVNLALAVAIQSDGKIVAAGFTSDPGERDFALARYNTDGSLDTSFGSGGKVTTDFFGNLDEARDVIVQSDGKIVLVGEAFLGPGDSDFALARYNTDGSLDTSFGSSGKLTSRFFGSSSIATAAIFQSDGKIVVGGSGPVGFMVVRYNSDGSLDTSFGSSGIASSSFLGAVFAMAMQNDGKIVVTGIGTSFVFSTLRYNSDGSPDTGFGSGGIVNEGFSGGESIPFGVAIQNGDKIVVGGVTQTNTTGRDFALVRYNNDGSLDTSFGNGGKVTTDFSNSQDMASAIAVQGDGKIVAAGTAEFNVGGSDFAVARYDGGGSGFDICLQDDSNGNLLQFNPTTGDYKFSNCRKGFTLTGRGTVSVRFCKVELQDVERDRNISVLVNTCTHAGTASVRDSSRNQTFTISDRDITNNTCSCR